MVIGVTLAGPACTEATVAGPSQLGNNAPFTVETFSGTLAVGGSRFYSFNVPRTGFTGVTLLSLKQNGAETTETVILGVGVPRGVDCPSLDARNTGVGVTPQVSFTPDAGIYCVRIGDAGTLTAPVDFSINISRPR
jgi:hypothetical protein